ncbi:nucleotidyltransferase family protein [Candidatus Caldatribacterium sp.]|uniref:nucleotidyltransferase family protein n=1 Tax=Candidatus Caldatribacterium sp. TaxID=2282143 RepID=UPI003849D962|nr:nucleotidyltransferase family protein [Candidatus Caldatribacterium sp.]
MKKREEIEEILREHKAELREKYGVSEIGLFGSSVRGREHRRSDVDILVEFDTVPGLLKFLELEEYLSHLLGVRVDLVRRASIRKELRERILSEVRTL